MASGSAALKDEVPNLAALPARRGPERLVLIAGGGIGGLATALALARRGLASYVLERRPAFAEEGAGIQIGPNGSRILAELGVADILAPQVATPDALSILDAITGDRLARLPLGRWIAARHGAPYWTAHRQDLHAALLARARAEPLIVLAMGADISYTRSDGAAVMAGADDGRTWTGEALVVAQGLWSPLRAGMLHAAPRPARKTAARAVVPIDAVEDGPWRREVCLWLAPRAHIVHYPVRAGQELAIVVIFEDAQVSTEWSRDIDPTTIREVAARFPESLRALLVQAPSWRAWSLHTLAALPRFAHGRIALLGDAAHPVLPFLAQGAMLALEDAVVLADRLAVTDSVPQALRDYEARRRARVRRVLRASRLNGTLYHLSGMAARARNMGLAAVPPERLMAGYDWIYGWQ